VITVQEQRVAMFSWRSTDSSENTLNYVFKVDSVAFQLKMQIQQASDRNFKKSWKILEVKYEQKSVKNQKEHTHDFNECKKQFSNSFC